MYLFVKPPEAIYMAVVESSRTTAARHAAEKACLQRGGSYYYIYTYTEVKNHGCEKLHPWNLENILFLKRQCWLQISLKSQNCSMCQSVALIPLTRLQPKLVEEQMSEFHEIW